MREFARDQLAVVGYSITVPRLAGTYVTPEWAWAFFVASSAVLGAWCGAKSQPYVPENRLRLMLGAVTGLGGLAYALDYLVRLVL